MDASTSHVHASSSGDLHATDVIYLAVFGQMMKTRVLLPLFCLESVWGLLVCLIQCLIHCLLDSMLSQSLCQHIRRTL